MEMDVDAELAVKPVGCTPCLQRVPGVLFHPTESNVLFLAWVYKAGSTGKFKPLLCAL
jgi:hypothetical protein